MMIPENYFYNVFAIPAFFTGVLVLFLGFFVLYNERGSRVGWRFLFFSFCIGLYFFASGIGFSSRGQPLSLIWFRIAHIGAIFIPASVTILTLEIIGAESLKRSLIQTTMGISIVLCTLALFSDWLIRDNPFTIWYYYPRYGIAGFIFLGYFGTVMVVILKAFWREFKNSRSPLYRQRMKGMFLAFGIGYMGALDFIPALGLIFYAFGFIPILIFVITMAYVIIHYHLVDITPELAAGQILNTMQSAVILSDLEGRIRVANPATYRMLNIPGPELLGQQLESVVSLPQDTSIRKDEGESATTCEMDWSTESGRLCIVSLDITSLIDKSSSRVGTVYVAEDITDRKQAELKMEKLALFDTLTGLPNRTLAVDRVQQMVAHARRNNHHLAFLYMDLDRFKEINDNYGHEAGDSILMESARRMKGCVRHSDTVARWGGDEFIGLCDQISTPDNARTVAEKIVRVFSDPFMIAGRECSIGVSIGISLFPQDGENFDILLASADKAMYRAKRNEGESISFSTPGSDESGE